MDLEKYEEEIKDILQTRFDGICTSSGVFSGYQLSHQVGGQFAGMIIEALQPAIEEARAKERERIVKIYDETIAICPQAGLVAILEALEGGE